MKVDDILKIDNKNSNREKAAWIRAQLLKKAKDNNPRQGDIPTGWNGDPHQGSGGSAL